MRYRLRENLFCCDIGGRFVFMDVAADRYFRLPPGREAALKQHLLGGQVAAEDRQALIARGVIASAAQGPAPLPPLPDSRDLVLPPALRPRRRDVARSLAARLAMRQRLRRVRLARLLEESCSATARRREPPRDAEPRILALAGAFAASRAFLRSQDRCLADALAMMALCRREALCATLIFGVRLDPFAAHCWVQARQVVITGDVDDARTCSAILAVP